MEPLSSYKSSKSADRNLQQKAEQEQKEQISSRLVMRLLGLLLCLERDRSNTFLSLESLNSGRVSDFQFTTNGNTAYIHNKPKNNVRKRNETCSNLNWSFSKFYTKINVNCIGLWGPPETETENVFFVRITSAYSDSLVFRRCV